VTRTQVDRRVDIVDHEGGHAVAVAGKVILTPRRRPLAVPTKGLAKAIAEEWRVHSKPDPRRMPMTALAATVLDRIGPERKTIESQLADYAETELLCHRAAEPAALAARQATMWQPLLDWLAAAHDAPLTITHGIFPRAHAPGSLLAIARLLAGIDPWTLGALALAVPASGSLVIGVALIDGRIDAGQAFEAAELEATYQIETWGEDGEAAARRAGIRADLAAALRFVQRLERATPPN
jgi:chaperone required for assembly of F1-ATPase